MPGDTGARAQNHVALGPGIGQDQETVLTMVGVIAQVHRTPQLHAIRMTVQVSNCCKQRDRITFLVSSISFAEARDPRW